MPLSLISLASNIDESIYDVVIIDARLEKDPHTKLLQNGKDAFLVGMTVLTGAPIKDALEASRKLKVQFPLLKIIWGGWHPSLFPAETLKEEAIDITVQGQGEEVFSCLVDRISNEESYSDLRGISFKEGGKIIRNPPNEIKDMNEFRFQKYEHVQVKSYFKLKGQKQFDFISSIGCFFRCTFCADPQVYNRKWSALSPQRLGEEISYHWNKYNFDELSFQDETFFTYKGRAVSIADEFIKRNLKFKWTATMRADQGARLSEEVFRHLVRSGLRWVLIGVESGSDEMLKWLKKDISIDQVMYCAEICRKYGIAAHFPVIIGFPGESDQSVIDSLSIANRLREMSPRFETPVFYYKPYPGSSITAEVEKQGYRTPESLQEWSEFDYIGSSGPWVSKEKFEYIEKFKFYNRLSGGKERMYKKPLQKISRWRIKNDNFSFPIEKTIIETIRPLEKVS